jgi:hypothetical protein
MGSDANGLSVGWSAVAVARALLVLVKPGAEASGLLRRQERLDASAHLGVALGHAGAVRLAVAGTFVALGGLEVEQAAHLGGLLVCQIDRLAEHIDAVLDAVRAVHALRDRLGGDAEERDRRRDKEESGHGE